MKPQVNPCSAFFSPHGPIPEFYDLAINDIHVFLKNSLLRTVANKPEISFPARDESVG